MSSTDSILMGDNLAPEQSSVFAVASALIAFAALAWLALRPVTLAPVQGIHAAPAVYAQARAQADAAYLAQAPRPLASAANAQARAYIVGSLQAMGLAPQVQSASATQVTRLADGASTVQTGLVHNVLVRLAGKASKHGRSPALLVAAHYDSGAASGDAAGSGQTVAAMLETLRALGHGGALANDVIFLFADGEHTGSLGARAFAEQHPWARQVGLVLQFDGSDERGPLLLTGTRGGNGKLIGGWAAAAPSPQGSSALALLAAKAPGLRQGAPLDALGQAGMRFASVDTGRASAAAMQHAGDTMLALTRHFGNQKLAAIASADHLHFDLPLVGQVHYPSHAVWPITRLVCLMVALACCIAVRRSGVPAGRLAAGAAAFFAMTALLALTAVSLWSGAAPSAGGGDSWVLLAVIALALAVFIECQRMLLKAIGMPAALLGALLVMTALLVLASALQPGISYLLAWPMTGALLAYAAVQAPPLAARSSSLRLAILMLGSAPAIILFAPLLLHMTTLFTFQRSLVLVLALTLMLGLGTAPLAALRRRFVSPLLLLLCAGSLTAAARATPEPARPVPSALTYLKDGDSWQSWWLLPSGAMEKAPASEVAFPELLALSDELHNGKRKIVFSVRAKNNAPTLDIRVEGTATLRAVMDGRLLTARPARSWSASVHGTAGQVHRFDFDLVPGNTARIIVQERKSGLPSDAGRTGPGLTIATDTLVFR